MRVAVVIATLGRPVEAGQLLTRLARQTQPPSAVVLSVTDPHDLPPCLPDNVQVAMGSKGLCAQRNRGMALVMAGHDLLVFFDDDYVPSDRALEGIAKLFERYGDVVGANGALLADGINSAGIDFEKALTLIEEYDRGAQPEPEILKERRGLYGCNMAYRISTISGARFDEALPLYAWQEDIDFAAQLLPRGRLVLSNAFAGVHRGVKGARASGFKLGYSQVVNPIYLSRKGTMRPGYAATLIAKNVVANHLKSFRPEPWVDRWGRVRGNWRAFWHLLTGRAHPQRMLEFS